MALCEIKDFKCINCGTQYRRSLKLPIRANCPTKQKELPDRYEGKSDFTKNSELFRKLGYNILDEPCAHRGATERVEKCQLCGGKEREEEVFNCRKFDTPAVEMPYDWRTNRRDSLKELVCKRCPHYEPRQESENSDQEAVPETKGEQSQSGRFNWFGADEDQP